VRADGGFGVFGDPSVREVFKPVDAKDLFGRGE